MHRVPIWFGILILFLLIFVAISGNTAEYSINQEKIWTIIGVNFVLLIIGLIKR